MLKPYFVVVVILLGLAIGRSRQAMAGSRNLPHHHGEALEEPSKLVNVTTAGQEDSKQANATTTASARQGDHPTGQCYVDSGVLVIFPVDTPSLRKEDILDSLLFAQLAADKSYSRETETEDWFGYFEYVLQNIGWVLTSTKFDVEVGDDYFVFASLALNQMAGNRWKEGDIETFRGLFNTLHGLPDADTSVQILYGNTYSNSTNGSSLILCSFKETLEKEVQLSLLMLGFEGLSESAYRYLFHAYRSKGVTFSQAKTSHMVLNEEVFQKIRATVIEKLGDRVKTMISEVKIPKI